MLNQMYLVPADHFRRDKRSRRLPSPGQRKSSTSSKHKPHNSYEEWVMMRRKIREADIRRKTHTKTISDFLRRVMPDTTTSISNRANSSHLSKPRLAKQLIVHKVEEAKTPNTRRRRLPRQFLRHLERSCRSPL